MKALKSELAKKILKFAFYDKKLANKIRNNEQFEFEGKKYNIHNYQHSIKE